MIILGLLLGIIAGVLAGGRMVRLIDVRLRWMGLIFLALILRFGTETAISNGVDFADTLRLPLYGGAFGLLVGGLWPNRHQPGLLAVIVGAAANGLAIVLNAGWMPVWPPALAAVGMGMSDLNLEFPHAPARPPSTPDFFLHGGPIGDILPDTDPAAQQRRRALVMPSSPRASAGSRLPPCCAGTRTRTAASTWDQARAR